ncbi:MAG: HAD-IIIC family phosphatase [Archangium sp.]|nr:HAD-IIIC family phosphatase [Archangium sp.]
MSAPSLADLLKPLQNPKATLVEQLSALKALDASTHSFRAVKVGVSANVTVDLLTHALKKHGYLRGVRVEVVQGSYDAHRDNMVAFAKAGVTHVVLLGYFDNLLPALESRLPSMEPAVIDELKQKVQSELQVVLSEAKGFTQVYATTFHAAFDSTPAGGTVAEVLRAFNGVLAAEAKAFANVKVLDTAPMLETVGRAEALSPRFFYQAKAPYTLAFFDELARQVTLVSRAYNGYFYKALVLDCDNTLWGGIVGEDLLAGIKLGPYETPGNVFYAAQAQYLALQKHGVLLCLCSKNNGADVDEVLAKHPHQLIKDEHLILKKVNWQPKVDNLKDIASDLNIGLDSLVFIDDSDFEVAAVREQLPMVKTIQVPKTAHAYPQVWRELRELFLAGGVTAESAAKTAQYRQLAEAAAERKAYGSQEEYLKSLQLKVTLRRNPADFVPRVAELSQKSNQFNLTTTRYTEGDIQNLMRDPTAAVYSLHVADRFGDHGLTGVAVVRYRGETTVVENFLMSCRVIGRGVEFVVWNHIFKTAQAKGTTRVEGEFVRSAKNVLVEEFFDQLGLPRLEADAKHHRYAANFSQLALKPYDHVEVIYVE